MADHQTRHGNLTQGAANMCQRIAGELAIVALVGGHIEYGYHCGDTRLLSQAMYRLLKNFRLEHGPASDIERVMRRSKIR
ncbi:hypothetical protein D3C84_875050 [compost metagenome]